MFSLLAISKAFGKWLLLHLDGSGSCTQVGQLIHVFGLVHRVKPLTSLFIHLHAKVLFQPGQIKANIVAQIGQEFAASQEILLQVANFAD